MFAKVDADQFGEARATVADGKHAREIVMDGTCEYAAENNPQIGRGTEFGSHDGTENRTGSGNVQELDHEDLPGGHLDVIDSVCFGDGWGGAAVFRGEEALNQLAVDQVPADQGGNADDE